MDGLPLEVTLWGADGAANALGNRMVNELSDGDSGGVLMTEDADGDRSIPIAITPRAHVRRLPERYAAVACHIDRHGGRAERNPPTC